MGHGPATEWGKDNAATYKQRLGIAMFGVYTIVYAGFVVINSVSPKLMGAPLGPVNIAVIYGFGLIGFALVLAFLYNALCTRTEARLNLRTKEAADWFDVMRAEGKIPSSWNKEQVMVFCDTLIAMETEVNYEEGRNLTAIEAFQRLFDGGKK